MWKWVTSVSCYDLVKWLFKIPSCIGATILHSWTDQRLWHLRPQLWCLSWSCPSQIQGRLSHRIPGKFASSPRHVTDWHPCNLFRTSSGDLRWTLRASFYLDTTSSPLQLGYHTHLMLRTKIHPRSLTILPTPLLVHSMSARLLQMLAQPLSKNGRWQSSGRIGYPQKGKSWTTLPNPFCVKLWRTEKVT